MCTSIYLWPFISQKGFQILQNIHNTERLKNTTTQKNKNKSWRYQAQLRVGTTQLKMSVVSLHNVCCKDGSLCSCWATNSALNLAANRETWASRWLSWRKTTLNSKNSEEFLLKGCCRIITKSSALFPEEAQWWGSWGCPTIMRALGLLDTPPHVAVFHLWSCLWFTRTWESLREGGWQHTVFLD